MPFYLYFVAFNERKKNIFNHIYLDYGAFDNNNNNKKKPRKIIITALTN